MVETKFGCRHPSLVQKLPHIFGCSQNDDNYHWNIHCVGNLIMCHLLACHFSSLHAARDRSLRVGFRHKVVFRGVILSNFFFSFFFFFGFFFLLGFWVFFCEEKKTQFLFSSQQRTCSSHKGSALLLQPHLHLILYYMRVCVICLNNQSLLTACVTCRNKHWGFVFFQEHYIL